MIVKSKTETIAEFLARGGKITKVPSIKVESKNQSVKKVPVSGHATILSIDEAELFYGETDSKKKVKKITRSPSLLDVSVLPEALKSKYINRLKDEVSDVEES